MVKGVAGLMVVVVVVVGTEPHTTLSGWALPWVVLGSQLSVQPERVPGVLVGRPVEAM